VRDAVVFCLCLSIGVAANAFEGQIIGPGGTALAGGRVSELGKAGSVVADSQGRFRLEPDPRPPFYLMVTRPDGVAFRPFYVEALPPRGDVLLVRLETLAENVTVVSGGVPDLHLPPAAAGTVMGKQDLARRMPVNLPQALENIPGTTGAADGYDPVPGLRGLPKHRTLILLDDGRVTAERRAGPSATFLFAETVDEIEVVRGPGSVAYGSDAFGGVIRARSRLPMPGQPVEVRYSVFGAYGLRGGGATVEASAPVGDGALLVGGHFRVFDEYQGPHGRVPNSDAEHRGFRLAYQVPVLGGALGLGWRSDFGRDIGKPEPQFAVRRTFYPEENSHRFNVSYQRPGPGQWSRLGVSLAWDSYQVILDRDVFATSTRPRAVSRADVDANDYSLRVEGERPVAGLAKLVAGIDVSGRYNLSAINSTLTYGQCPRCAPTATTREVSVADARRDDYAAFAAVDAEVARVRLAAGVRADQVRAENSGGYFGDRSVTDSRGSGFLAGTFLLGAGAELTLQAAKGFRSPLLSDRFYRGISGRGFITGNPDLKPETSTQYDVAFRWNASPFSLGAYGYLYRIQDLIERYRTGDNFFFRNRGEAEIRGAELEAAWAVAGEHSLGFGAQVLRGEVRGDKTPVDDIPPRGVFVVYRHEPVEGLTWMARTAAYARDDRPGPTEKVVPGHTVVDASIGYRFPSGVDLSLVGRNLSDRAYPGSADEAAALAPGRSLQLVLRGKL